MTDSILEWFVAISVILVGIAGIGSLVYFIAWLYAHVFRLLVDLFKIQRDFIDFVQWKYKTGKYTEVYTPKMKK